MLPNCISRHYLELLVNPGSHFAKIVCNELTDHQGKWDFLSHKPENTQVHIRILHMTLPYNQQPPHASSTESPFSPLSLLFHRNQYITLLLRSFYMQCMIFLKVPYRGRYYHESQVNPPVPLSARCVTIYQGNRCQLF